MTDTRKADHGTGPAADKADTSEAATQLNTGPAATLDGALGPNWQAWQEHIVRHVQLPDTDDDTPATVEAPAQVTVPLLVYGDGPHDYIATNVGDGAVVVQDGNDKTGKTWQFPIDQFMRFVAHANGKTVDGDDTAEGDNPLVAAAKQQERTNALVDADRKAGERAEDTGKADNRSNKR